MYKDAYSIGIDKVIDAEKAYELFWEDIINDVHAFTCSVEGCEARFTLSSVNKERRLLRQIPHFRCYGTHKKDCPNDEKNNIAKEVTLEGKGITNRTIEKKVDIIHCERQERTTATTDVSRFDLEKSNITKRKYLDKIQRDGKRESDYYTIIPIVSKYEDYKNKKSLYENFISFEGKETSYGKFFIELISLNINAFNDYNRIYFGNAKLYETKDKNNFRIVFSDQIIYQGKTYQPSAYISEKIITNSFKHKKWLAELQHYATNKEKLIVFILGKLILNKDKKNTNDIKDKEYLNIYICNAKLDLVDIRINNV